MLVGKGGGIPGMTFGRSGGAMAGGMSEMMAGMSKGMYGRGMMMGGPMMGADAKAKVEETTLTRTDFAIHFIWQPPEAGKEPPALEDIRKSLVEAEEKAKNAPKALSEADLVKASQAMMQRAIELQTKAITEAVKGATPPAAAAAAAPGTAAPAGEAEKTAPAPAPDAAKAVPE
jgi:hypothetical protein